MANVEKRYVLELPDYEPVSSLVKARKQAYKVVLDGMGINILENEKSRPGMFVIHWTNKGMVARKSGRTFYMTSEKHKGYTLYKTYILNKDGKLGRLEDTTRRM